ncbi:hypothetical protein VMCG_00785 [Cytospora schulzeri]|uniref:Uncharacterized protein n=1 Tax=Cytospora schulzeri TaxID=448051 RepID=A0A423XA83_9PEZI|nr:hypothetical protein VMCG_00785 [Valsa malicola]
MVDEHILHRKEKVPARSSAAAPRAVEPSPYQPMDPAIPTIVSEIQFRLDQDPQGWRRTASDQFTDWLENCLYKDSGHHEEEHTLSSGPPPFSATCPCGTTAPSGAPWSSGPCSSGTSSSPQVREPPRRDFRRPGFSARERDGCPSCRVLSRFLLDRSRVRAIFPVVGRRKPSCRTIIIAGRAVVRLRALTARACQCLPLLADRKRVYRVLVGMEVCGRAGGEDWDRICQVAKFTGDEAEMVSKRRSVEAGTLEAGMDLVNFAFSEDSKAEKFRSSHDKDPEGRVRVRHAPGGDDGGGEGGSHSDREIRTSAVLLIRKEKDGWEYVSYVVGHVL